MHIRQSFPRRRMVLVTAAAAVLATPGLAFAIDAVTSSDIINACYQTAAPFHLFFRSRPVCPTITTPLAWNQHGAPGPAGAQGPPGPQGPPGSPGLTGFHTVTASDNVPAGNIGTVDVSCGPGETAIGGGYTVPFTVTVLESHPQAGSPGVWRTAAAFPSSSGVLTIYVQCAVVAAAPLVAARLPPGRAKVTFSPLRR
jgi:hypothetical protein